MPFPKQHMDRDKSERWITACRREGYGKVSTTLRNTHSAVHLLVAFTDEIRRPTSNV